MNKKSLILLLMMLMASTSMVLGINTYSDDSQKKDVILDEKESWNESESPRSLDRLIWTCYYENGMVYLNVLFEMGSVTLTVTNLATGESWNYRQESGTGWIVLPTSQSHGNYQVEVVTKSSGEYIGYYDL